MPNSNPAPCRGRRAVVICLSLLPTGIFFLSGCRSSLQTTEAPAFQRKYGDFAYCPIPLTEQTTRHSCGPACLSTLLTYWDADIAEAHILETYPTPQRRPYYLVELRAVAEAEGRKAYILAMDTQPRREAEQQILKGRPLLCAVRLPLTPYFLADVPVLGPVVTSLAWALPPHKDHYVVVAGLKDQRVLLMDPAHGFATLPWRRFERAWSRMKYACLLVSN